MPPANRQRIDQLTQSAARIDGANDNLIVLKNDNSLVLAKANLLPTQSATGPAITHITTAFNSITDKVNSALYGDTDANSRLAVLKRYDADIGLFRPAKLHDADATGNTLGFDSNTGSVRPIKPTGLVAIEVSSSLITLFVETSTATGRINSVPANYRVRIREQGTTTWPANQTYNLAKQAVEGANTPYRSAGTIVALDLSKTYEYQISADAGANYLDLHTASYVNLLIDNDNFLKLAAELNADISREIVAGTANITAAQVIGLIEHAVGADRLDTQFLQGNPYAEQVLTLPDASNRRIGELIVEKSGDNYEIKYLAPSTAIATPDRNKITIMTGFTRFFRYDPTSTDGGESIRNYNHFVGWYRRNTIGAQYWISLYLRQDMLAGLNISASARTTQFHAAITTIGGTKTYLPFVRARSQSIINGHNYLEYISPQGTAVGRPAGQNTTYDIFFQKNGADLNIFPATTMGQGWVSTDPDHTDIIATIEAATGDARLDIQALKNSPLIPAGASLPTTTGLRANQLFILEAGNTRTLYFLTDQSRAIANRNQIEVATGIRVATGLDDQGNTTYAIKYDADLPDESEGGRAVRNYNTFVGFLQRQQVSASPNRYVMLMYLRQDMLSGAGIPTSVSQTTAFKAAFTTSTEAKTYLTFTRTPQTDYVKGHEYLAYTSAISPTGVLTGYPNVASTTYTISFQQATNTNNLDIWPANENIPDTWVEISGGSSGGGGGLTTSQVQALIANWAEQGNADLIPLNKLPSLNGTIDARIQTWARSGNTSTLPLNKLPSLNTTIDARVSDWARSGNATAIPANKLSNAPSGGLTQTQVDNRVKAGVFDWAETANTSPIPANKLTNAPSGGLNQAAVDARVQAGVEDWAETGNKEIIPKGKLPIEKPINEVATLTITAATNAEGNVDYGAGNTGTATFTIENTTYTIKRLVRDNTDNDLSMFLSVGTAALTATQKTNLHLAHFELTDGSMLDFDDVFFSTDAGNATEYQWSGIEAAALVAGSNTIKIYLDITENNYVPIPTASEAGDVLTAGADGSTSWQTSHGAIASSTLVSGVGAGLSLTNLNSFRSSGLQLLSPTFDMDDKTGIVEFEANLTINNPSPNTLRFVSSSGELTHTLQGFRTIQDLLAIAVFHATNASGVKLDEVDLYLGSINAGSVELWLERNANNELGYSLQYTNNNSATGSCAIGSTIRGVFIPTDSGPAPDITHPAVRELSIVNTPLDANVTRAGTTANTWTTATTLITAPAITSNQVGGVVIFAHVEAVSATAATGGGDRIVLESSLMRTRGSTTTELDRRNIYIRNMTATLLTADTGNADLAFADTAELGDVYFVQTRQRSQIANRSLNLSASQNRLQIIAGLSSVAGRPPQVIDMTDTTRTVSAGAVGTSTTSDRIRGSRYGLPAIADGPNVSIHNNNTAGNPFTLKAGAYRIITIFSSIYTGGTNDDSRQSGITINLVGVTSTARTFIPLLITGTTAANAPKQVASEHYVYTPTDETGAGFRLDARRLGTTLYGLAGTLDRIIIQPLGNSASAIGSTPAFREPQRIIFSTNNTIRTGAGATLASRTVQVGNNQTGANITFPAISADADVSLDNAGVSGTTASLKKGAYIITALLGNVICGGSQEGATGIQFHVNGIGITTTSEKVALLPNTGEIATTSIQLGGYVEVETIIYTPTDIDGNLVMRFNAVRMAGRYYGFQATLYAIKIFQIR